MGKLEVTAPAGVNAAGKEEMLAAIYSAIRQSKEKMDAWLKASQRIFRDKAACKTISGPGGALKPGQEKTLPITIKNIRGERTDEDVVLKGVNGLVIVKPTGKVTAKKGVVNVTVRAPSQRFLAGYASATTTYGLGVESVSELGRGVGTVSFRPPGLKFSGLKWRFEDRDTPTVIFGYAEYEVISAQNCSGDPLGLWNLRVHVVSNHRRYPETNVDTYVDATWSPAFSGGSLGLGGIPTWQPLTTTATLDFSGTVPVQVQLGTQPDYIPYSRLVPTAPVEEDPTCK